jgi:hypothetical protein
LAATDVPATWARTTRSRCEECDISFTCEIVHFSFTDAWPLSTHTNIAHRSSQPMKHPKLFTFPYRRLAFKHSHQHCT